MSSFRTKQTFERVTGGYYDDDGMWHDGEAETIEIIASVQPLNQNEKTQYVDMLPEGAVNYNAVKIYSNTQLRVEKQEQGEAVGQEADVLLWRGKRYKIVNCEEWQSNVISHFRMVGWEVGAYGE
jgi:hypothetical protein